MIGLLILFFCVSILFSFLCSIWEAVLLSITPSYAQIKIKEGGQIGQLLEEFKSNIDRPLAAILTLNTIAHTLGAMGVGAQAEKIWPTGSGASAIVGALMTLAILILSEIIPKTLGANHWQKLTPFTVRSLKIIIFLLKPLVWFSQIITKKLKKDKNKSVLSRADFTAMAELGVLEGVIRQNESKMLQNLLHFHNVRTKDIMTPRTVVKSALQTTSINDFFNANQELHFSRIPIYDGNHDVITGFVLKDEILTSIINNNGAAELSVIRRDIMVVNQDTVLPQLFNKLMEKREHIALVVGEFGGMAGIVTMEDVIETLLGMEIVDELDSIEDMQQLARKKWETRAKSMQVIEPKEDQTGSKSS